MPSPPVVFLINVAKPDSLAKTENASAEEYTTPSTNKYIFPLKPTEFLGLTVVV